MNRSVRFINVVPAFPDHPEFTISEILRQHREVGLSRFALSLTFHPQGTPARNKIPRLCGLFRTIREGLRKNGEVELGALIQSTQGHGDSVKVPPTGEPWQLTVQMDGTGILGRMCSLDPGFRAYIRDVIRETVQAGAAFLLIDDDFGPRINECLCPLHIARFNEAVNRNFSREETAALLTERPWSDPLVRAFSRLRKETALEFAGVIRSAIDEADPSVRCGLCTPTAGHGFVGDCAKILAGKTEPFIRVNNAIYGMQTPMNFYTEMQGTHRVRHQAPEVKEFLDESDTFPQNYYSESALAFHAHITNGLLNGLTGCKLWTSEFNYPEDRHSQRRYESYLARYRGFYDALLQTVDSVRWKGVSGLLFRPEFGTHIIRAGGALMEPDWCTEFLGPFGFPVTYSGDEAPVIHALCGKDVKHLEDSRLRTLLSGSLLVDGAAAKELSRRGFSDLTGVQADEGDENFFFFKEYDEKGISQGLGWDSVSACLTPIDDTVQILTWFGKGAARTDAKEPVAPAMIFFRNRLGGRVAVTGWSPTPPWYKLMRPIHRVWIRQALDLLSGGVLEMSVENADQQVLVRHGLLSDGRELVTLQNIALDLLPPAELRLLRNPKTVEMLTPEGRWEPVKFHRTGGELLSVGPELPCCEVKVFRFAF